ncbi:hypothetical protein P4C99_14400 [Pontiellaceae bacterium B1224]|nr:hypothetical protein [Pontiellaceae bacterium B1224]
MGNIENRLFILILSLWITGCTSSNMLDEEYRTNQLRELYPAEVTTKSKIHERLQSKPNVLIERPENGWEDYDDPLLSQKLLTIEKQTGKRIQRVERYIKHDPRSSSDFYSLCNLWYYYDSEERLVDVVWEHHTD